MSAWADTCDLAYQICDPQAHSGSGGRATTAPESGRFGDQIPLTHAGVTALIDRRGRGASTLAHNFRPSVAGSGVPTALSLLYYGGMAEGAPSWLRDVLAFAEGEREHATIVAIAPDATILWVNHAWARFAQKNGGEDALRRVAVGDSYLDGIDGALHDFYREVFETVMSTGKPYEQQYECSSPESYQLYHLSVSPVGKQALLVVHSLARSGPHEEGISSADEQAYRDEHGLVHQCSNCRRVQRVGNGWHWVASWVAAPPRSTSHGMCGVCAGLYWGAQLLRRAQAVRTTPEK